MLSTARLLIQKTASLSLLEMMVGLMLALSLGLSWRGVIQELVRRSEWV